MRILFTIFLFAIVNHANAEAQSTQGGMLCTTELSSGIAFDASGRSWRATIFKENAKYMLARSKINNKEWVVSQLGKDLPAAFCKGDFSGEMIMCDGVSGDFYFNRKTLRFLHVYTAGYWDEESLKSLNPGRMEGDDKPAVSAGVCARL